MDDGDVITISKRGQWVNRGVGGEELSQSFRSREEAEEAGVITDEAVDDGS